MEALSLTLFFVVVALLIVAAILGKQPDRPPARWATLMAAIGAYVVYEYATQQAYPEYNVRVDLLIYLALFAWACATNLSTPPRRMLDGPDLRRSPDSAAADDSNPIP